MIRWAERLFVLTLWILLSSTASADTQSKKQAVPSAAKVQKMDFWKFCAAYGKFIRKGAPDDNKEIEQAYLSRAGKEFGVTINERTPIEAKRIQIGMSQCGVVAAIGEPEHTNQTHTARGTSAQWVYPGHRFYVYIDNGVVTSWQN